MDSYLKFSRPGNKCLLCDNPLNVDGRHPSLIEVSDEEDDIVRKDFCHECWENLGKSDYFSFWVTRRITAASPEERRLAKSERNDALWRLFSALYADETSDFAPQLFLLSHLLMKYRVLQYKGINEDGSLNFVHQKLGESFKIPELPLDAVDFVSLKEDIEKQAVNLVHGEVPEESDAEPVEDPQGGEQE